MQEDMKMPNARADFSAAMAGVSSVGAEERSQLQRELLAFIDREAGMTKGLAAQGKKDLAREVVHLRALIKTVRQAAANVKPAMPDFGHAEAFRLMTYRQVESGDAMPEVLLVWNSRDGITPFIIHVGERKYEHDIKCMAGPYFDRPAQSTHEWVTRTDAQVLEAWGRTMTKAVEMGKIEPEKAEAMRGDLTVAESWHYRIGLRNMATGRFTDEEVLKAAEARPTEEQVRDAMHTTYAVTKDVAGDLAKLVMRMFNGTALPLEDKPNPTEA